MMMMTTMTGEPKSDDTNRCWMTRSKTSSQFTQRRGSRLRLPRYSPTVEATARDILTIRLLGALKC
eukprot:3512637-Pyramimonas_sp.AAC.1